MWIFFSPYFLCWYEIYTFLVGIFLLLLFLIPWIRFGTTLAKCPIQLRSVAWVGYQDGGGKMNIDLGYRNLTTSILCTFLKITKTYKIMEDLIVLDVALMKFFCCANIFIYFLDKISKSTSTFFYWCASVTYVNRF